MTKRSIKNVVMLLCAIIILGNVMVANAAEEKKENSWRYKNGQPISDLLRSARTASSDAWGKVDGQFINDRGEVIEGAVRKGVDVSKWQGDINWEKVKNTDVDFAIIRCGYGDNLTSYDDKKWKRNADECTRLGIPFGTYIYSYATSVEEARSEAEHVLRLVKGYNLDYPIYFDMEDDSTVGIGKEKLTEIAKTFCDIITDNGYEVGVYANKYWWTTYLTDPVFEQWDKWVAQYNSVCNYDGAYSLWQCASDGKVDGINGNADINFEFAGWRADTIKTNMESPQPMNKSIKVSADIRGNTDGLQYKFVWEKNNWEQWGVIQEFNDADSAVWTPQEGGSYNLYMDVKDINGTSETIKIPYDIAYWYHDELKPNKSTPQVKNHEIEIYENVAGEKLGLQYKFVWMKDNWDKWGVIQDFSEKDIAIWKPEEEGKYYLYVDIRDGIGTKDTQIIEFDILQKAWKLNEVLITEKPEVGKEVSITPDVSKFVDNIDPDNLQFKYVWMKNNWEEWGVIKDFSSEGVVSWIPKMSGSYDIYVDVKDEEGIKETVSKKINVSKPHWEYEKINSSLKSPQVNSSTITFSPIISGNTYGLQYKFVWMKDNWNTWGVIQDFSELSSAAYQFETIGDYEIYIDVKGMDGNTVTQILPFTIVDKSWAYDQVVILDGQTSVLGNEIQICPNVNNQVEGSEETDLEYKYVWMKNEWESWGILKEFSEQSVLQWKPEELGEYWIYVDVRDKTGKMVTQKAFVNIVQGQWNYQDVQVNQSAEKIQINPNVTGDAYGLQYKFVWMKDNWNKWGVIQDFSDISVIDWIPKETGTYKIYVDVRDKAGNMVTRIQEVIVE